jgi:hypothetical protein
MSLNTFHVEDRIGLASEAIHVNEGDQLLVHSAQVSARGKVAWLNCVVVDVEGDGATAAFDERVVDLTHLDDSMTAKV